jgi:hypothetical protein
MARTIAVRKQWILLIDLSFTVKELVARGTGTFRCRQARTPSVFRAGDTLLIDLESKTGRIVLEKESSSP